MQTSLASSARYAPVRARRRAAFERPSGGGGLADRRRGGGAAQVNGHNWGEVMLHGPVMSFVPVNTTEMQETTPAHFDINLTDVSQVTATVRPTPLPIFTRVRARRSDSSALPWR